MAKIFKPKRANGVNDPYWIQFVDQNDKRHRFNVLTPNAKAATNILAKKLVEVAENKFLDVRRSSGIRFVEHLEKVLTLKKGLKSYSTYHGCAKVLEAEFEKLKLTDVNLEAALSLQARLQTRTVKRKGQVHPISPARVNRITTVLFEVLEYAVAFELIQKNPMRNDKFSRLQEEEKIVRPIEVGVWRALEAAAHENAPPIFYVLMVIAFYTGMRLSNQAFLLRDQVDFENRKLLIGKTKTGRPLYLAMNDELYLVLKSVPVHPDSPYILADTDGRPYFRLLKARNRFRRMWDAVRKAAGVANMAWHDFRHNFGSQMAMAGYSQREIMDAMGHRSIITSARYMHWSPQRQLDAMNAMGQKFGTLSVAQAEDKKRHSNGTGPQLVEAAMSEATLKTLREVERISDLDGDQD